MASTANDKKAPMTQPDLSLIPDDKHDFVMKKWQDRVAKAGWKKKNKEIDEVKARIAKLDKSIKELPCRPGFCCCSYAEGCCNRIPLLRKWWIVKDKYDYLLVRETRFMG